MNMTTSTLLRFLLGLVLIAALAGCGKTGPETRAVYMLIDTSGTYTEQLNKAQTIINYLLATMDSGDSLAVARIDSGSFSEKDIIAKVTFDDRPSVATGQKRSFRQQVDNFVKTVKGSPYTDISGGMLQAVAFLNETGADKKHILVFSDLKEEIKKGNVRDFPLPMEGIEVVALNVTKLRSDNVDPRQYLSRLDDWDNKVVSGGGHWRVVNDLDRLDMILTGPDENRQS